MHVPDYPHCIPGLQGRGHLPKDRLDSVAVLKLGPQQVITMQRMILQRRECGPGCQALVVAIER
jgi:hypothetical protein